MKKSYNGLSSTTNDIYGDKDAKFHAREGRKYFIFYIKPIINGVGNYYIEAPRRGA